MQSMAPLPFDELEDLLVDLMSAHRERQHWILQHWPHVVESAEVAGAQVPATQSRDLLEDLLG
jgi:hypothetical protein